MALKVQDISEFLEHVVQCAASFSDALFLLGQPPLPGPLSFPRYGMVSLFFSVFGRVFSSGCLGFKTPASGTPSPSVIASDRQFAQSVEPTRSLHTFQAVAKEIWTYILSEDGLAQCSRCQPLQRCQRGAVKEGEDICRTSQNGEWTFSSPLGC